MANILLKKPNGTEIVYFGVNSITVPTLEGENVKFVEGSGGGGVPGGYSVTFYADDEIFAFVSVTPGNAIKGIENPTRTGYYFTGWYTAATGGDEITFPYTPANDVTLYAQFTAVTAAVPSISVHPQNASYSAGGTATALSVTASVGDGGTLSYQWQKSTDGGSTWNNISGATSTSYTPNISTASTYKYRCIVTNTLNGSTASTTSNAATITVTASGYTVNVSTGGANNGITIYDGQNSSAPVVFDDSDENLVPVTITSGYMFIECEDQVTYSTSSSGGVSIISQTYGLGGTVLCAVTGNGSLYVENACYVEGTPITLSDRTYKNVEDITYTDELLVWNFDKGCFDKANPICILRAKTALEYNQLTFSDGSVLKTINQHRIFNIESGKFTYPMTDATPIGTHTLNDKGEVIELVDKRVLVEKVVYYNIITKYHINCFASTILTSCRLNNIYPIENLKFIKDDREIKPYAQFNRITRDEYEGYRAGEQPENINADNSVCFGDKTVEDYIIRCRSNSKPR